MENAKNVTIAEFCSYNARRYSMPWVCSMTDDGRYDFNKRIGTYTGGKGEEGRLVVFSPEIGAVYGYGQKDYRGSGTEIRYKKWVGDQFVQCDKLGNAKQE